MSLIAFVSISLVVSSIMIGIITYISVLERTKEIGILRAIGASKHDVSRVFNAETLIEGLIAGLLGVGLTLVLILPINAVVQHLTGIASLGAKLPWQAGVALIAISMLLTFLAGLIPSSLAAKKDPGRCTADRVKKEPAEPIQTGRRASFLFLHEKTVRLEKFLIHKGRRGLRTDA